MRKLMRITLFTEKELYVNGAVLLDYREDGLHTHYMTIVKKRSGNDTGGKPRLQLRNDLFRAAKTENTGAG